MLLVAVGALFAMGTYLGRGMNARVKASTDDLLRVEEGDTSGELTQQRGMPFQDETAAIAAGDQATSTFEIHAAGGGGDATTTIAAVGGRRTTSYSEGVTATSAVVFHSRIGPEKQPTDTPGGQTPRLIRVPPTPKDPRLQKLTGGD